MATNPFFDFAASASRFVDFDVPTAADLNTPLDEVTAGFDAVNAVSGQAQMDLKAPLASPALTGTPTAPTAAAGTATTQIATTAFVDAIAFTTATGLTAASQAEMEAGTESALRAMSPLRVAQAVASLADNLPREARASNTILAATDRGKFIEYTGSFTQTFGTAAALGADWYVFLKNAFTDSVYLTPAGGATIDGVTDFLMYPGEARLLQCDGTNFHSVVLKPFEATYTASGFFFKPPGYSKFGFQLWGAGGSGRRDTSGSDKTGGGGGACAIGELRASAMGASETITLGAGGAAVSTDTTDGNAGGNSTIGSLVTAYGGAGGTATNALGGAAFLSGVAFADSHVVGSGLTSSGAPAYMGGASPSTTAGRARTIWGGAAGGSITAADVLVNDSSSVYGGAGGAAVLAAAGGVAGTAPGGGGGSTKSGTASGAGARGELRIYGIV
jgi:hypothetical protein